MSKIRIEIGDNSADIYRDGEWWAAIDDLGSEEEGHKSDLDELLAQARFYIAFKLRLERQYGPGGKHV